MTTIEPKPDIAVNGWQTTGQRWLHTLFQGLQRIPTNATDVDVRMPLSWVHLFDWTSASSLLANRLTSRDIDLRLDVGESSPHVLDFLRALNTEHELAKMTKSQVRLVGGTSTSYARHEQSVLMGLMRIHTDADAIQYLDQSRINRWREAMVSQLPSAPLLEHEALWRLLCFELAGNIAEHAGSVGFLAAHIIQESTFLPIDDFVLPFRRSHLGPFLNLCVSDSGRGLVSSLEETYRKRHGLSDKKNVVAADVVAFAFHETGSRKDFLESWLTDRHALSRCLHLVEQYGGSLRLRTAGAEFRYDLTSAGPERAPSGLGYLATEQPRPWIADMPGTHLQILLPLAPIAQHHVRSPLRRVLPARFAIEDDFPIGHYVPLSCYFTSEDSHDVGKFVRAAARLARLLMRARPPDEALVFDLEDLAWTRGQLETFVILMENIISRRATLLLRLPSSLAEELGERAVIEWNTRRSALLNVMWRRVLLRVADVSSATERAALAGTTLVSANEKRVIVVVGRDCMKRRDLIDRLCETWRTLGEGDLSLPTLEIRDQESDGSGSYECAGRANDTPKRFHGVHDVWSTVLAFDRAGTAHVLAYEGPAYARALTSLVYDAVKAGELATRSRLPLGRLSGVLIRSQPLFQCGPDGVWQCCWDERALKGQARRSAVLDFEHVVALTGAWQGNSPFERRATLQKFYLPAAHKWLDGFLESSRILGRERYADEVAQRLVSALRQRGSDHPQQPAALVATTTPALMLANALAQWLELDDIHVPVLDIGDHVVRGGRLPVQMAGWVILVQDVVSSGEQSLAIIEAIEQAGADRVTLMSYVRLQMAETSEARAPLLGGTRAPLVALVTARGPSATVGHLRDEGAFFIEPRTLHPIPGGWFLRPHTSRLVDGDQPRDLIAWETRHFDMSRPMIRSGHFIVGHRHHTITVDIRALADNELGGQIADEVAAICLGLRAGHANEDISMVLMPLDSQVRYLWARVQERLARSNRRQPFAFLEVASVLGAFPTYLPPRPLQRQAMLAAMEARPLRILVFDDAVITGATIHQVLMTIQIAASKAFTRHHAESVEQVTSYAVVDRLTRSEHRFAHNVRTFGKPVFPVTIVSPLALLGPRPFHEETCPACEELQTVWRVRASSIAEHSPQVAKWCRDREKQLSPEFIQLTTVIANASALRVPIVVTDDETMGGLPSVDLAITRFEQLMSLGYPVVEVLQRMIADPGTAMETAPASDRYRWEVLAWCLRHWSRFRSFPPAGKDAFVEAVEREIAAGSQIVPSILAECAKMARSAQAYAIFQIAIRDFAQLDAGRLADIGEETFRRAVSLETGLLVFFALLRSGFDESLNQKYEQIVAAASTARETTPNRVGLRRLLTQASGLIYDRPRVFALQCLAETVCRELAPDFAKPQAHDVLPKLLSRLSQGSPDESIRHFAAELLALFIRAATTLDLYSGFFGAGKPASTLAAANTLLAELVNGAATLSEIDTLAREFEALHDTFLTHFSKRFNMSIRELIGALENTRQDRLAEIELVWEATRELYETTMLTDALRLRNYIANIVIDPSGKQHMSGAAPRIAVSRIPSPEGRDRVQIDISTFFVGAQRRNPKGGVKYEFDRDELRHWGVEVDEIDEDIAGGLRFVLRVPIGFPREAVGGGLT